MGERGDIIRTMQRELTARNLDRAGVDHRIHDMPSEEIVGRVIDRGFSDEHRDRHYLIVDGVDGRVHYLDIGRGDQTEPTPEHSIVRIAPRNATVRDVDRTVVDVAEVNGGRYSIDAHLRHDASATQGFAEAHVRRLDAMRRAGSTIERMADGSWTIGADHLDQAAAHEARGLRDRPVEIETVSTLPIAGLETVDAATWLDRELNTTAPLPIRDAGFGREVRAALDARRQWLIEQELADVDGGKLRLRANAIMLLQRRELLGAGERLAGELGKPFVEAAMGSTVEGRLTRRVDLASGRFALVEQSREFTLVPWRPMLEKQIGNQVSGLMRSEGVSWRFGRGRGGPEIS